MEIEEEVPDWYQWYTEMLEAMEPGIRSLFEPSFMVVTDWIASGCPKNRWVEICGGLRAVAEYMEKECKGLSAHKKGVATILHKESLKVHPDFNIVQGAFTILMEK